ncbi:Metallo-dependent phosphatase-like protein [Aspergillus undulatus]|uniref:Metallo-dependent phosphatase-like protein n=1 Tax=Aspergillus undulatus TaxID=1810928 RepID=UPI003CCCEAA3
MRASTASALLVAVGATANARPTVDTHYPYTGPDVPGYPRLVEPPAVKPKIAHPTHNISVISLSYVPGGMHIRYQTRFGPGETPSVRWGKVRMTLSVRYDRTPSCERVKAITQCSQFFHEVSIDGLETETTTYYYQLPGANGTTEKAGADGSFTVAVLNDMGYTNAQGTHRELLKAANEGTAFAWHGGDLSYADDWFSGILPCADDWPEYLMPLPDGETANQGGPNGGDMSVLYKSNWDLWQQWMVNLTLKIPHMHRFRMPGTETGGIGNYWYSFDYGLAHFISLDGETDFANTPFSTPQEGVTGDEDFSTPDETSTTKSGPFGTVDGSFKDTKSYAQYKWLKKDLASIDRTKTPWSSDYSSYQTNLRAAVEDLLLQHGVDAYLSGHIQPRFKKSIDPDSSIDYHLSWQHGNSYRSNNSHTAREGHLGCIYDCGGRQTRGALKLSKPSRQSARWVFC